MNIGSPPDRIFSEKAGCLQEKILENGTSLETSQIDSNKLPCVISGRWTACLATPVPFFEAAGRSSKRSMMIRPHFVFGSSGD